MILGAFVVVVTGILVVNYFKDRNASTIPAISTENQKIPGGSHEVTKGESLWSIAEDYYGSGYNWTDVAEENKLSDYSLEIGQILSIPDVSPKEPTSTSDTLESEKGPAITGNSYTVVKGDSLWKIAVSAYGDGYRWTDIAEANNLDNPNVIHSGNVLVLPR